jgi:GNAT superfamily N-acetyltransferase
VDGEVRSGVQAIDDDVTIRPMTEADRPAMRESTRAAFDDLLRRLGTSAEPADGPVAPSSNSGAAIVGQLLELDSAGAWVTTIDGQVCGAAMAGLRERLWYLAHLHVRPGLQGRGVGRRLLEAALRYGADARGRLLHSSLDPQAMRCYQRAGFALEPALQAVGVVRRAALPAGGRARAGGADDVDLAAEVDRGVRGAAHGPDLQVLLRAGARLLVLDDRRERGYVVIDAGTPKMLAATSTRAAVELLWAALAECGEHAVTVEILRGDQQWAIDVAHRAGLSLAPMGPLCRQGDTGPLAPYLPHADIL